MNIITNPGKLRGFERHAVKVENVSRRSMLKGLGIAGGFGEDWGSAGSGVIAAADLASVAVATGLTVNLGTGA